MYVLYYEDCKFQLWRSYLHNSVIPRIVTSAPAEANPSAVCRPIPRVPPVTRATFPVKLGMSFIVQLDIFTLPKFLLHYVNYLFI